MSLKHSWQKILFRYLSWRSPSIRYCMAWQLAIQTKKYFPGAMLLLKSYLNDRTFKVELESTLQPTINLSWYSTRKRHHSFLLYTIHSRYNTFDTTLLGPMTTTPQYFFSATTSTKQTSNCKTTWTTFSIGLTLGELKSMTPNQLISHLPSGRKSAPITINNTPQTNEVKYPGLGFDKRLT